MAVLLPEGQDQRGVVRLGRALLLYDARGLPKRAGPRVRGHDPFGPDSVRAGFPGRLDHTQVLRDFRRPR